MTDDARQVLAEEERARIQVATRRGGLCAGCGRTLADDEPVWWATFVLSGVYGRRVRRWVPVGRECAPPEVLRATEGREPEPCIGCGRAIHYGATTRRGQLAACSRRCRNRQHSARARERRKA